MQELTPDWQCSVSISLVSVGDQLNFNMLKALSRGKLMGCEQLATGCFAAASLPGFKPTTFRSQVRRPTSRLRRHRMLVMGTRSQGRQKKVDKLSPTAKRKQCATGSQICQRHEVRGTNDSCAPFWLPFVLLVSSVVMVPCTEIQRVFGLIFKRLTLL